MALHRGARAVVEDPCDANAAAALAGETAELVRVPVDADGLRTDCLPAGNVALVHVTPEHQRPLGVTLERGRRIALLAWAERIGALILEEDCEGELRYGELNAPSLMSLDTEGRVIMLGGFCTSLGPWLDLAYLVLPRPLIAPALAARRLIDDSRRCLEETALAELLSGGGYARHVHRLGKAYASRRDALLAALHRHFGAPATTWGEQAGLHLAWFPPAETGSPGYLATLARRCGLEAAALPANTRGSLPNGQALLLGFGALPERQIASRVAQFANLVQASSLGTAPAILMRKGYQVATVGPTALIAEVMDILARRRIGAVLVIDRAEKLLGIVSERDIVRSVAANGARTLEMTAGQLMTRALQTATPATTADEAMRMMTEGRFRHLPVVDHDRMVGLISIGDLVKAGVVQEADEGDGLGAPAARAA